MNDIERLVRMIAREATIENDVPLQSRVDALKVLTPYYLALRKDRHNEDDSDDTMAELARAMNEDGNAKVRGHRGTQ